MTVAAERNVNGITQQFTDEVRARRYKIMGTREFRRQIDAVLVALRTLTTSREIALAVTETQRAFMWAGKILQDLGAPNPYPASTDPNSPVIEPRADQATNLIKLPEDHVAAVKGLRKLLDPLIEAFTDPQSIAEWQVYTALCEGKMWLGWELDRMHQSEKSGQAAVVARMKDVLGLPTEGKPEFLRKIID